MAKPLAPRSSSKTPSPVMEKNGLDDAPDGGFWLSVCPSSVVDVAAGVSVVGDGVPSPGCVPLGVRSGNEGWVLVGIGAFAVCP